MSQVTLPHRNVQPAPSDAWAVELGVSAVLQANLAELRAVKDAEGLCIHRHSLWAAAAVVAMCALHATRPDSPATWWLALLTALWLHTLWVQDALRKLRRTYFRAARSAVRAQNYLGLFEAGILPDHFADPFPRGLGKNPHRDGTQPYSSFLRRQVYAFSWLAGVGAGVSLVRPGFWPFVVALVVLDAAWIVWIFRTDQATLRSDSISERDLAGASPSWFDTPGATAYEHGPRSAA